MYCGQGTIVKHHPGGRTASVLRCRSWRCEHCQPNRRRGLIAEAAGGSPRTFLTLTLRADDPRKPADRVKALSRAWRIIRQRLTRLTGGKEIEFLAVVEQTKRGTPHLHILARAPFISQRWLSQACAELLDAPIVDIRRIDKHRAILGYVAKYVGKNPQKVGSAKRYWKSKRYDLRPPTDKQSDGLSKGQAEICDLSLASIASSWKLTTWLLEWLSPDRLRATYQNPGGSAYGS